MSKKTENTPYFQIVCLCLVLLVLISIISEEFLKKTQNDFRKEATSPQQNDSKTIWRMPTSDTLNKDSIDVYGPMTYDAVR